MNSFISNASFILHPGVLGSQLEGLTFFFLTFDFAVILDFWEKLQKYYTLFLCTIHPDSQDVSISSC